LRCLCEKASEQSRNEALDEAADLAGYFFGTGVNAAPAIRALKSRPSGTYVYSPKPVVDMRAKLKRDPWKHP